MRRNLRQADPRLRHATFRPKEVRTYWIKAWAQVVRHLRWYLVSLMLVTLSQVILRDSTAERSLWLQALGIFTLAFALTWLTRAIRLRVHQRLRNRFATTIARVKGGS